MHQPSSYGAPPCRDALLYLGQQPLRHNFIVCAATQAYPTHIIHFTSVR